MPTRLEILLDQIDPRRALVDAAARVDRAVNRFQGTRRAVTNFEEYKDLLGRFLAHVEAEVLRVAAMYEPHRGTYQDRACNS